MEELKSLTDFIPVSIKPLHLQVIDRLQKLTHVDDSALLDVKSGNLVAANKALMLRLTDEQCKQCIGAFTKQKQIREEGFQFLGLKYDVVRADRKAIYAKSDGREGLIMVKADEYIILVTYTSTMLPSVSAEAAEKMGEYFTRNIAP